MKRMKCATGDILKYFLAQERTITPAFDSFAGNFQVGFTTDAATGIISVTTSQSGGTTLNDQVGVWQLKDMSTYESLTYHGTLLPGRYIAFAGENNVLISRYENTTGATQNDVALGIPAGTVSIWADNRVGSGAPEFSFDIEGTQKVLEVTDDYADWQELVVSQYRVEDTAVFSKMSYPIELTGKGRDFINNLVAQHGIHAKVNFQVWKRDNWKLTKYYLMADLPLNFLSYKDFAGRVQIDSRDADLAALWNSKGRIKYDIPVAEVADAKGWHYQRLDMVNRGAWFPVGGQFVSGSTVFKSFSLYVNRNVNGVEMIPGSAEHDFRDQNFADYSNGEYFFRAAEAVNIKLKIKLTMAKIDSSPIGSPSLHIRTMPNNIGFTGWSFNQASPGTRVIDETLEISLNAGDAIQLYATAQLYNGGYQMPEITEVEEFSIEYEAAGLPLDGTDNNNPIQLIDPQILLQKFLDLISEKPGYFRGSIQWTDAPYKLMLAAADSIRNFPLMTTTEGGLVQTLHTSPKDLAKWLRSLGYEIEFDGRNLTFKPRDAAYQSNVMALELGPREMGDLVIISDPDHAYTSVEVGYEKQDYESVNGKFEANGTFQYTTGFITEEENKLDLTSPYRADPIGIELLCWERDKLTTDTKSDNDVFAVAVVDEGDHYEEYRGIVIKDRESGIEMFNAPLNPYYLVSANESLIGIITQNLHFASTDMSKTADIVPSGNPTMPVPVFNIYGDRVITKKLHEPFRYHFEAGSNRLTFQIPSPDKRNGLVYFTYQGKRLKGYIYEIKRNEAKEKASEWELYMVK